jgi:hypothetical protein
MLWQALPAILSAASCCIVHVICVSHDIMRVLYVMRVLQSFTHEESCNPLHSNGVANRGCLTSCSCSVVTVHRAALTKYKMHRAAALPPS